jgi:Family of unknown function (DUF6600)
MKAFIKIFILFIVLNAGTWMAPQKASAQVSVSFQLFYDDLSPYGYWVDNSDYGYVWVPNVSAGFTPYGTNGHWVFTNAGWTWFSDYSWGWAPFHYGRWYTDPYYGPMWVPGNEWGPGWVTWRSSAGYYGWAPIGPGVSIELAYSNGYNVPYNQWTFVGERNFGSTNMSNYYVDRSTNTTIINNSTVINNMSGGAGGANYNAGPARTDVEKRSGSTFAPVTIKESSAPGQKLSNNELQIYKPQVQKNNSGGEKSAPARVTSLKEVKSAAERNPNTQSPEKIQSEKKQPAQRDLGSQPDKQKPAQQQRDVQPKKEQPAKQQRDAQPKKDQPAQQQRNVQPKKEQPAQRQRDVQPRQEQPSAQPQRDVQPRKEQPAQRKQNDQPAQQQRDVQPKKEQPAQQQRDVQPNREQPSAQPQRDGEPKKAQQPNRTNRTRKQPARQPSQQQQPAPQQNMHEDNKPH